MKSILGRMASAFTDPGRGAVLGLLIVTHIMAVAVGVLIGTHIDRW